MALVVLLAAGVSRTYAASGCKAPDFESSTSLESDILAQQNLVRAREGMPPLAWSGQLAEVARNWAATLLAKGLFMHSSDTRYGENLYEITGCTTTAEHVVSVWSVEAKNYNYQDNSCSGECGHYTQIVWRETRAVGCGVARGGGREIWACEYDPPGNFIGERPH